MPPFNQQEEFNKSINMPPPLPEEVPVEPIPEPEDPNTRVLEHMFENDNNKMEDNNSVLNHIFENQNDKFEDVTSVLNHSFELQNESLGELKNVKDELVKLNEPWDIKLILE